MRLLGFAKERKFFWVIFGIIPLMIVVAWILSVYVRQQNAMVRQFVQHSADHAVHAVDRAISAQIGLLEGLATSRSLDQGQFELFRINCSRLLRQHPEWRTVIITDEKKPLFNIRFAQGRPLPPLRDPDSLRAVWQERKVDLGNLVHGYVPLRVPVVREGVMRYTLVVPLAPWYFLQEIQAVLPKGQWQGALVDAKGVVLASSDERRWPVGNLMPVTFPGEESQSLLGINTSARIVSPLPSCQWQMALYLSHSPLVVHLNQMRWLLYGSVLVAVFVSVYLLYMLFSMVASRKETQRLRLEIEERKRAQVLLKASEQRLHLALDAAKAGVWEWDLRSGTNVWSEELWALFGLPRRSCTPRNAAWLKTVHPDDVPTVESLLQDAVEAETHLEIEWRTRAATDEPERWLLLRGKPQYGSRNRLTHYLGIVMDVSQQKIIAQELLASEQSLKEAQNLAGIGNWFWDLQTNVHRWSEEIYYIYGRDPAQAPAAYPEVQRYFQPESWQRLQAAIETVRVEGGEYEVDAAIVRDDGTSGWITARGTSCQDEEGGITGLRGTVQDITRRKQMEESLRFSEVRFRTLFAESLDAIALLGGEPLTFQAVNASFTKLFGYSEAETRAFVVPEDLDCLYAQDQATLFSWLSGIEHQGRQPIEHKIMCKDGQEKWVETSVTRIDLDHTLSVQVICRDISARKFAEEEREKLQQQFIQAQKMESVGRLAGGVAHDFNNLLAVIIGYTELALEEYDGPVRLEKYLQHIHEAANRSTDIIRQLLAFSRKQTIDPKVLDLNQTIGHMLNMLQRLIGEDIALNWLPGVDLPAVTMDPTQVDQILANLCVNARDAISGVGQITIETAVVLLDADYCTSHEGFVPGSFVCLTVTDSGCGMAQDIMRNIFEPFFTTKGSEGTGLGLSTVYGIVKQNKGFVNVYSEPESGTAFKVYLPTCFECFPERTVDLPRETAMSQGETVLFVEDDASVLQMALTMLERLGYKVLGAHTPKEALALSAEQLAGVDVLLTDVIMPEMNGRQLAEQLQQIKSTIRVLYISGYTANVIAHHGILDPGIHFLQKPFSQKDLSAKLREVLER